MATEPDPRLEGWKAIADYLGRDVRTAQRWRDERGMPVHRVPGGRGGTVFADRRELDEWLFQTVPANRPDATTPSDGHPHADPKLTDRSVSRRYTPRIAWSVASAITVIAIGVALKQVGTAQREAPARLELSGNTFIARAADESLLWSFALSLKAGPSIDGVVARRHTLQGTVLIPGQNDDGDSDIAAVVNFEKTASPSGLFLHSEVYWFRSGGTLRWKYTPHDRLGFSGREFAGPWRVMASAALPGTKTPLWMSFNDAVWWPSFVARFGSDGVPHRVFISPDTSTRWLASSPRTVCRSWPAASTTNIDRRRWQYWMKQDQRAHHKPAVRRSHVTTARPEGRGDTLSCRDPS